MTKILIIAEHDGTTLNPSTARCVSCADAIGGDTEILVLAADGQAIADQAASIEGVIAVHLV